MKTQIPDEVTFNKRKYSIIGINGNGLLTMMDFDVSPAARMAECLRGFYMRYALTDKHLLATRLTVIGKVPVYIDYIAPQSVADCSQQWCATQWDGLQRPARFSGKLLIGRSTLPKLLMDMGFQHPLAFRQVMELEFEKGILQHICDVSGQMILQRNTISHASFAPQPARKPENMQETWQQYKFSLNYDAWWLN